MVNADHTLQKNGSATHYAKYQQELSYSKQFARQLHKH